MPLAATKEDRFTQDFDAEDLEDARFRAFSSHWESLKTDVGVPASSFDLLALPPAFLPLITVIDVPPDGGLHIRLIGTEMADQAISELTGKFIQDLAGSEEVVKRIQVAIATGHPYFSDVQLSWARNKWRRSQSLVCPFVDAPSRRVSLIVALSLIR